MEEGIYRVVYTGGTYPGGIERYIPGWYLALHTRVVPSLTYPGGTYPALLHGCTYPALLHGCTWECYIPRVVPESVTYPGWYMRGKDYAQSYLQASLGRGEDYAQSSLFSSLGLREKPLRRLLSSSLGLREKPLRRVLPLSPLGP